MGLNITVFAFGVLMRLLSDVLEEWFCWVLAEVIDIAKSVIQSLFTVIPSEFSATISQAFLYTSFANSWVPVDTAITLFVAYTLFLFAWIVVRYTVAAIPTIG